MQKSAAPGNDSSPFQSSPVDSASSPRLFWQNRSSAENMHPAGGPASSPTRRSSIERLQKASRVRNSNILALEQRQEYDPTRLPQIERPLAKVQESIFTSPSSSGGLRSSESEERALDSKSSLSTMSPSKGSPTLSPSAQIVPGRGPASPTKSSLSPTKLNKGAFDPESGTWSGHSSLFEHELPEGRLLNRHPKSVTFDAAPPQVNEYEMATPDLSSIGTNSREGSYESADDEDDEDVLYDPTHIDVQDDSFDESLEDTDKTPVVSPDDWRGDSPMVAPSDVSGQYESSPVPESMPSQARARPSHKRTDSSNSNGDHRPLPPLPGLGHARSHSTDAAPASPGLSATAERMLGGGAHRSLPVPPPATASKSDIQSFGHGRMTLEERLKLMMLSDDGSAKSVAEQQRERRLRRGAGRERGDTPQSESGSVHGPEAEDHEGVAANHSILDDYQMPPRISREFIMRRVNGNEALQEDAEYRFSGSQHGSAERSSQAHEALDPDVPIPTTEDPAMHEAYLEDDEGSVIVTRDADEHGEDGVDDRDKMDESEDDDLAGPREGDDESHYSDNEPSREGSRSKEADAGITTPRAGSPAQRLLLNDPIPDLAPVSLATAVLAAGMTQAMVEAKADDAVEKVDPADPLPQLDPAVDDRPHTPERQMAMPDYDGSGWGDPESGIDDDEDEPGTPESVIRHPMPEDDDEPQESLVMPERIATIRSASGSKLKTRVSNTPADLAAMRHARRQFSQEVPAVPPIPEKHRNRTSRDMTPAEEEPQDEQLERNSSFKNRSLTLDLDMGLSLDQDFERVIEAQKVHYSCPPLAAGCPGRSAGIDLTGPHANATLGTQRGYLMRQNTKVVTASDKDADTSWKTRSANNSPVKHSRPQSWVIEPWDGQGRRRASRKRPGTAGAVQPPPAQDGGAPGPNHVVEEDSHSETATIDTVERGRLFVKVLGVKDLDLPLPKSRCPRSHAHGPG